MISERILLEVVQAMECPDDFLRDDKIKQGVINLVNTFDPATLEQLRSTDRESYHDVLRFLVAVYRDMDLDDRIAHFSCRCACEQLEELRNRVEFIRTDSGCRDTHISKYKCQEWADTLQRLVTEISNYSQYKAWANDVSSCITEDLLLIISRMENEDQ